MAETTYLPEVRCAVSPGGILPNGVTAIVEGIDGKHQYLQVTVGMINEHEGVNYLPVGFVEIDRRNRRVLIEFPVEADSGANRMWVSFDALMKEASREAEALA